jgi:hypothetical protein
MRGPKRIIVNKGDRYGRLRIIQEMEPYIDVRNNRIFRMFECICDCGNKKVMRLGNLRAGHAISCGCFKDEETLKRVTVHGESRSPEWSVWVGMIRRCKPNDANKKIYFDRGIKVCERWTEDKKGFINFLQDMGRRPSSKYSIDRINNDGNYEPGNVRWATDLTQNTNKRSNHFLEYNGEKKCISEWAKERKIKNATLWLRISKGWSIEKALNTPIRTWIK